MKKRKRRKPLLGGKVRPPLLLNPALRDVTHP